MCIIGWNDWCAIHFWAYGGRHLDYHGKPNCQEVAAHDISEYDNGMSVWIGKTIPKKPKNKAKHFPDPFHMT